MIETIPNTPLASRLITGLRWGFLFFLGLMYVTSDSMAQTYKSYFSLPSHGRVDTLSLHDLKVVNGGRELILTGDAAVHLPQQTHYSYVLRLDRDGHTRTEFGIGGTVSGTGFQMSSGSVTMDKAENIYWVGSHIQGSPRSAEKVMASYDRDGKIRWAGMNNATEYADVHYDAHDRTLVALGGATTLAQPNSPISLIKMEENGAALASISLEVSTASKAIALLDLPHGEGYITAARTDTAKGGTPHLWISRVDQRLTPVWSFRYPEISNPLTLEDIAYHPDGYIMATGTAFDQAAQHKVAFLLRLDMSGRIIRLDYFAAEIGLEMEGLGVAAFNDPATSESGTIVVGAYYPLNAPEQARTYAFYLNDLNQVIWSRDYTDLATPDEELKERATAVTYLVNKGQFAIGAESEVYDALGQLSRRRLWVAKAYATDGLTHRGSGQTCSRPMIIRRWTGNIAAVKEGVAVRAGGAMSYAFQTDLLDFSGNYCGYAREGNKFTHIDLDDQQAASWELMDLQGRVLTQWEGKAKQWSDAAAPLALPKGWYLIRTASVDGYQKVWIQ